MNRDLYEKAERLYEQEKYEAALELFKALEPSNEVRNYIGCCYMRMKEFEKSARVFTELMEKEPDWSRPVFNLGRTYLAMNEYNLAFEFLTAAADMDGDRDDAFFYRGLLYQTLEDYDSAISDYQRSLEINFSQPETHLNLGNCYDYEGLPEKAMEEYYSAIELDAGCAEGYFNIGRILMKRGQYTQAVRAFSECEKLLPNDVETIKKIVSCFCRLEDFESAKMWNEKLLLLCPDDEKVKRLHKKLCEKNEY
ncbi:MAG: tetratricopeptide repeat protein [Clostridia bacterium]|nr:tetratricopeptide repeat protein [Clostridia bacterium]